jgi:hypothetical protein
MVIIEITQSTHQIVRCVLYTNFLTKSSPRTLSPHTPGEETEAQSGGWGSLPTCLVRSVVDLGFELAVLVAAQPCWPW